MQHHLKILTELLNLVGHTVWMDDEMLQANCGRFARITVDIDLTRPLPPNVDLDGETLTITYEGFPQVCFMCGIVGHTPSACSRKTTAETATTSSVGNAGPGGTENRGPLEEPRGQQTDATSNGYGPWTNVQRRRPRAVKGQDHAGDSVKSKEKSRGGSQFTAQITPVEDATATPVDMITNVTSVGFGQRINLFNFHGIG
ncbi:hypothetical protein K2173_024074 [Erythroxylum novogranatense]|uniref:Zinc knuckle CX2CX4HX4C domain-containing protein n=1 Tax=Erythroxylum novogranatense TaxID=1862640 RepID=A0AAV8TQW8_9ROSI|nr:hypothetical protein K2173_024074 [Erythroxylum novogranatense]